MGDSPSISAGPLPSVAIVMPVKDEAGTIERAIDAARTQSYEGSLEVLVVDGGSGDDTVAIATSIAGRDPRVRLLDNPAGTAPAAMNIGIGATDADVIVRCDGHAVLPDGYVRRAVEILIETGADNVGGVQHAVGVSPLERAVAAAMRHPVGVGDARFRLGGPPGPADTVYLGAFRRDTVLAVGGFDPDMVRNQDYELNYRIRSADGLVWFSPDLVVDYVPRSTWSGIWRQYFDYGRGKRAMLRRHPRSLRWRQAAPPALVLGLVGSAALAVTPWSRAAWIVPGMYGLVVGSTAAIEAARRRDPAMALLVGVLPTMHLGWGTGFLVGRGLGDPQATSDA